MSNMTYRSKAEPDSNLAAVTALKRHGHVTVLRARLHAALLTPTTQHVSVVAWCAGFAVVVVMVSRGGTKARIASSLTTIVRDSALRALVER